MRFVDNWGVDAHLGEDWRRRVREARSALQHAEDPEERADVFRTYSDVWREVAPQLAKRSGGRCWYCDVRQVRSDMPIDHFRPKSRVAEECVVEVDAATGRKSRTWTHPGYWWLAFSCENFRYSCTFCNSRRLDVIADSAGGKQDHFPLLVGGTRAMREADNLKDEKHALLDPCEAGDPPLLIFNQTGRADPRYSEAQDPSKNLRARLSVRLYHLNHTKLKWRRRQLWAKVDKLVDRGSRYEEQERPLDDVKEDLHELIRGSNSMAPVARLAVRGRRDIEWVADWLEEVEPTL